MSYSHSLSDLSAYLSHIRAYPLLDPEEEHALSLEIAKTRDKKAIEKLVNSHLRLVIKTANKFSGYGLPLADLISEGNVGLMSAVYKFDPSMGYRFSTYAIWWIKAAITEYVLYNWSLLKIGTTAAQKKLFFNLRRLKNELGYDPKSLSQQEAKNIAQKLKVPLKDVLSMDMRLQGQEYSLNTAVGDEDTGEFLDWLTDDRQNQESAFADEEDAAWQKKQLYKAMEGLDPRKQSIIKSRYLDDKPQTLEEISQKFDISRERVRQIEKSAIEALQKNIGFSKQPVPKRAAKKGAPKRNTSAL